MLVIAASFGVVKEMGSKVGGVCFVNGDTSQTSGWDPPHKLKRVQIFFECDSDSRSNIMGPNIGGVCFVNISFLN